MNKNFSLKIYYIAIAVILSLLFLSIFLNYYLNKSFLFNKTLNNHINYNNHLETYVDSEIEMMKSFIYFITENKKIEERFIDSDKIELFEEVNPIFNLLLKNNSITHLYFIKNDGKVFLRAHDIQKDQDQINRYTFLKAQKENNITYGCEFGTKNTFTLRLVYPWYKNGSLIGYVEIGKEIDKISNEITKQLNLDLFYLIKKEIFNSSSTNTNEIELNNEKYIVAYHTQNSNYHLDNSKHISNLNSEWIFENQKAFIKTTEILYDVSKKDLGYKVFLIDVTSEYLELKKTLFFYSFITIISSLIMIFLGYIFSNKMQKNLNSLLKKLEKEKTKATDLYIQQKSLLSLFDKGDSVLFRWNNDEEWTIDYVSKNVKKIFGYDKKEFLNNVITYEQCIHKSDLNRVKEEVKGIMGSKEIYFKHEPYRIVTKNGKTKWISDYTIINLNKKNEITHFLGYIVDITKEYKFQQNLERFIETQENIVILTDGKRLNFANKKMFKFLGFKNLEDFLENHNCICEFFIENDKFFHLGKIDASINWVDYMETLEEQNKIVQIENESKIKHIFTVSITNFDEKLKIVSFTDITQTIETQIKLEEQTIKDNLTNAYNRNYFDLKHPQIIEDSLINNLKLGIAILDIDHFKKINDTFGHDIGDYVLKELVKNIHNTIRNDDILIRWGGEEFLLLLKVTCELDLEKVLNHLRTQIESISLELVGNITCSIGGTIYKLNKPIEESIKIADVCLYKAKNNGRNQVVLDFI